MNFQKKFLGLSLISIITVAGCSNRPQATLGENKTSASHQINNTVAQKEQAHNFVEIEFDKGKTHLSENSKESLRSVMAQAKEDGSVDEVMVLSWSDENYPSKNSKALSKRQRKLAEMRNTNVANYLKTLSNIDVDTYNMAEKPSTLSRLFNTTDTKLKNSFLAAGLSTSASKASHSVVLVKVQ